MFVSIAPSQHCFHTHIKPSSITRHWLEMGLNVIRNNRHIKITKRIFFDCNRFDITKYGTTQIKSVSFPMIVTLSE